MPASPSLLSALVFGAALAAAAPAQARLAPDGEGRTLLHFEHLGLVPDLQCWDVCNQGWNYFLPSLKQFAETGRGTPFALEAQAA